MTDSEYIYRIVGINPEPWAIGPLGTVARKGKHVPFVGKNGTLFDYQNAIKGALETQEPVLFDHPCELEFYFWRKLERYETTSGRDHQRHAADATNMQKALEDALQGVLVTNDRLVRRVESTIVSQAPTTAPGIVIVQRGYRPTPFFAPGIIPLDWTAQREAVESIPDLGNMI